MDRVSVDVRVIAPGDLEAYIRAFHAAFVEVVGPDELRRWRRTWERTDVLERAIAAYDGTEIVGTSATKPFELTVPGPAAIPVAGVSAVSVLPTHRRRGILTELMRRELDGAEQRGEVALILYASEGEIYGRFGYGPATFAADYSITTSGVRFAPTFQDDGRVTLVDGATGRERIPDIGNRHARVQPGSIPRHSAVWEDWFEAMKDGFFAVHQDRQGRDDGYLAYHAKPPPLTGERATVIVARLAALTDEAYAALWRYVLRLDLVGEVSAGGRPVREPLRWRLTDPRRLRTTASYDGIWVRLLDIPAALGRRRYFAEDSLVMLVDDPFRPANAGCYALEAGPHGARCARADRDADLALDVAQLGSVYLAGVSFAELARGGLVEERRPGAILRADQMFRSPMPPWCTTGF